MEDIDDIWKSVTSASVCDALGRICNHRAHVLDLVSPTPGKVLCQRRCNIRPRGGVKSGHAAVTGAMARALTR